MVLGACSWGLVRLGMHYFGFRGGLCSLLGFMNLVLIFGFA